MSAGRRLLFGGLAGPLLGLAVLAGVLAPATTATAGAARASGRAAVSHAKSPIGYYNEFSSNGGTGQIHIEVNNAFETNYGDTGGWVETKTSIALVVFTSTEGDDNCVYLGKWSSRGINTKKKQGPTSCSGSGDTWYALRTPGPTSTPSVDRRAGTVKTASRPGVKGVGHYTMHFEAAVGTLDLSANGTAVANDGQAPMSGYWVGLSKAVAFETKRSNEVCVWVGLLDKTGIASSAKPAAVYCHDEAGPSIWYATK
jgi:hypothetical protein